MFCVCPSCFFMNIPDITSNRQLLPASRIPHHQTHHPERGSTNRKLEILLILPSFIMIKHKLDSFCFDVFLLSFWSIYHTCQAIEDILYEFFLFGSSWWISFSICSIFAAVNRHHRVRITSSGWFVMIVVEWPKPPLRIVYLTDRWFFSWYPVQQPIQDRCLLTIFSAKVVLDAKFSNTLRAWYTPLRSDSLVSLNRVKFETRRSSKSASTIASTSALHCSSWASTSSSVSSLMISIASMATSVFSCASKDTKLPAHQASQTRHRAPHALPKCSKP